jgi:cytochrome c553
MPAWSGQNRDDEVWAVVAFLEALPSMAKVDYRRHASGHSETQDPAIKEVANAGRPKLDLTACSRCHDTVDADPISPYVPRIAGQDEAYLKRALHDYQDDMRQSGFMEPVASDLDDGQIERLAAYYASLTPVFHQSMQPSSAAERELGRQLAEQGDRTRKIPACNSCHGRKGREDYPRLAGQSEQYIRQQLQILRQGVRDKTPHGAMMTVVAKRMTEQQVAAVVSFFANQPSWLERSQEQSLPP